MESGDHKNNASDPDEHRLFRTLPSLLCLFGPPPVNACLEGEAARPCDITQCHCSITAVKVIHTHVNKPECADEYARHSGHLTNCSEQLISVFIFSQIQTFEMIRGKVVFV